MLLDLLMIKRVIFYLQTYYYNLLLPAKLPELKHNVVKTTRRNNCVTATKNIDVTPVEKGDLDFALGKACNEKDIYVYFMQAYPLQQDFSEPVNEKIKESSDLIPPRILQSVHGYFSCRDDHPTRINLSASWDKETVGSRDGWGNTLKRCVDIVKLKILSCSWRRGYGKYRSSHF